MDADEARFWANVDCTLPPQDWQKIRRDRAAAIAKREEVPAPIQCACTRCQKLIEENQPGARWVEHQLQKYGTSICEDCGADYAERYGHPTGSLVARHRPACQTIEDDRHKVRPTYKSIPRDDERIGRAKSLDELLDSLERTITVVVRAFIGRHPWWEGDYDDICQAARLKICEVHRQEPAIGKPAAFWAAVVNNVCLQYTKPARMRRPAKSTQLGSVDTAAVSGTPAVIVEEVESVCGDDIDKLIVQRRAEGFTFADIAAETGVSKTRLKGRLDKIEERYLERNPNEFKAEGKRAQAKLPRGGRVSVEYGRPSRSTSDQTLETT
jgi:DNA-directed RNA polymerase specialized sigma24 family protein